MTNGTSASPASSLNGSSALHTDSIRRTRTWPTREFRQTEAHRRSDSEYYRRNQDIWDNEKVFSAREVTAILERELREYRAMVGEPARPPVRGPRWRPPDDFNDAVKMIWVRGGKWALIFAIVVAFSYSIFKRLVF